MAFTKHLDFLSLHYAYILTCALVAFIILVGARNISVVDAFFFACSGNTESGLNTIDVNDLLLYQQLVIYFFPIITNLGFINIIVVFVRLYWFEKRLKEFAPRLLKSKSACNDTEGQYGSSHPRDADPEAPRLSRTAQGNGKDVKDDNKFHEQNTGTAASSNEYADDEYVPSSKVVWADEVDRSRKGKGKALRIPTPRDFEKGLPLEEVDMSDEEDEDDITEIKDRIASGSDGPSAYRRRSMSRRGSMALERIASSSASMAATATRSFFVLGDAPSRGRNDDPNVRLSPRRSRSRSSQYAARAQETLPTLSSKATIGRNSNFDHLTALDREKLGGIEYRSLKLLRTLVLCYFFGLHIFGVLALLPWILNTPQYREVLAPLSIEPVWWAFYSAQTMVDNLGFTITPTSMIPFNTATWPMLVMTFLAFAGNTFYPVLLRLLIWTMHKVLPKSSGLQEPLRFLLDHPRRCYTLLFPSRVTWTLFSILFALNFVDTLLIITLDLDNPEVTALAPGPRILAALFQAASSRHTGTSSFGLANVNPGVQFSLVVMMYISIFPIAISIRSSDVNEEKGLARYTPPRTAPSNSQPAKTYIRNHMRSQLSFDLWYICAGAFMICAAESEKIMSGENTAFTVFAILFEVTSAYGNVGLSLGTMATNTSLCGEFGTFGKLVICAMMLRGRHRGLPTSLDRAVTLPGEEFMTDRDDDVAGPPREEDAVRDENMMELRRPKTM